MATNPTTPAMLQLPPELMLRVSAHLSTLDLGSFRLTCKQVETNLFESFAREFFTKRQFMIERVSLEALVGIANHKTLAPYLNEVILGLDTLQETDPLRHHHGSNIDRDVFLATGRARDFLVEAFSKLPSLRKVGLRDYDANGRSREGEMAKWKSYGWSLGQTPSYPHYRKRYAPPDSLLPLLLFALSEASIRPTNLEAFLRRKRMPDCSFDLAYLPSNVAPVLSGLRTLLLSLDDGPSFPGQQGKTGHSHLKNFLQHTPLLEHLRLNFTSMHDASSYAAGGAEDLLGWLGTPSGNTVTSEPTPIALDHLTTLDLGMVSMRSETLLQVVSKFASLKALSLWKVTIARGKDRNIELVGRVWSQLLPKLGKAFQAPEDVTSVMIGFAVEEVGIGRSEDTSDVKFANKVSIDSNGEKKYEDFEQKASYRKRVGSNVQDWFEDLGNRALAEVPEMSDDSHDSDDDDDDEGEEDNDDEDDEHSEDNE